MLFVFIQPVAAVGNLPQPFHQTELGCGIQLLINDRSKLKQIAGYFHPLQSILQQFAALAAAQVKQVFQHQSQCLFFLGVDAVISAHDFGQQRCTGQIDVVGFRTLLFVTKQAQQAFNHSN